jgi:maltose alpha-D-glucosyltransferase/alpha-amylase
MTMLLNEPSWYKDAIIYEVHVRAFCDAVGDGYGNFRGLTQKLDYLQDLGVTAVWLLPFYRSPLRDDGYDIADYTGIHESYGSLDDFREFLDGAHQHGLRVITELVINHTSDQHAWFQRARRSPPGSTYRDFYVWSDTPEKYREARVIFKDFEISNWTYDHVARAYYWHRFYSHQPDLNFDNPEVWQALIPVIDFWFGLGVDGLRLDAVPYLFEREGTNCENLAETHTFLRTVRRHVDDHFSNRMLLAEANQWPEDAVAYFGRGDECQMAFHFPVMPRLFMAMHMEDRYPIVDILDQTPTIPETCQWALFLRNHDELTLEMVTDEERDYMYRAYARDRQARVNLGIRRRLAPLLGNNRRRIELMNGLLFSLPGTPVLYYGDEIGMGDNIYLGDRNGVRTPMQWSSDRNAGFSRANPQRLYLPIIIDPEYHYEAINVEAQQNNPNSLLWWMKRLIGQRRAHAAFGRGSIEFLHPDNRRILAFVREFDGEHLLVVTNLSRFVQYVELDLTRFSGSLPIELFGATTFPRIGAAPYVLTLGPHSFFWFQISSVDQPDARRLLPTSTVDAAELWIGFEWEKLFEARGVRQLETAIRLYLDHQQRGTERRVLRAVHLRESFHVPVGENHAYLTVVDVEYNRGTADICMIPIAYATAAEAASWPPGEPRDVIVQLTGSQPGVLYDALSLPGLTDLLLTAIERDRCLVGSTQGTLRGWQSPLYSLVRGSDDDHNVPTVLSAEQANRSVRFGNRLLLKMYRRIEDGLHPELEVGRHLALHPDTSNVAPLAGALEYRTRSGERLVVGVLHGFVPNQGDAWHLTLDALGSFFEGVATLPPRHPIDPAPLWQVSTVCPVPVGEPSIEFLHGYLTMVQLLGRRLCELHRALASDPPGTEFGPDPFTGQYQRAIYQSLRNALFDVVSRLQRQANRLPADLLPKLSAILERQSAILAEFRMVIEQRIHGPRIHCHGDCHLHQVLYTGKDFVFIDLEGRSAVSIGERWIKRPPLRDVVSLLRSFDYAAHATLFGLASGRGRATGVVRPEDRPALLPWSHAWRCWVHSAFLTGYLDRSHGEVLVPAEKGQFDVLFRTLLFEQLLSELSYESQYRPEWLDIPLTGLLEVLSQAALGSPQPGRSQPGES